MAGHYRAAQRIVLAYHTNRQAHHHQSLGLKESAREQTEGGTGTQSREEGAGRPTLASALAVLGQQSPLPLCAIMRPYLVGRIWRILPDVSRLRGRFLGSSVLFLSCARAARGLRLGVRNLRSLGQICGRIAWLLGRRGTLRYGYLGYPNTVPVRSRTLVVQIRPS
eukprot:644726-Rhodomonas_salina.2